MSVKSSFPRIRLQTALLSIICICFSVASAKDYSIDNLLVALKKNPKVDSIDGALSLLPKELRSNFTLVYDSHAINRSNPDRPRAIVFSKDAKFVLSFNHEKNMGHDSLEIMQYDDLKEKFEFFDLTFPLKRQRNGQIVRPEANPALCIGCHLQEAKPIWGTVNRWPNVFGSHDDFLLDQELIDFKNFRKRSQDSVRYKYLQFSRDDEIFPYRTNDSASPARRPNLRMTVMMTRLFARQLANRVLNAPLYGKYRNVIRYNLCVNQDDHRIPPALERKILSSLRKDTGYSYSNIRNSNWLLSTLTNTYLNDFCWADTLQMSPAPDCLDQANDHGISMRKLIATFIEMNSMGDLSAIESDHQSLSYRYSRAGDAKKFAATADQIAKPFQYRNGCRAIETRLLNQFR